MIITPHITHELTWRCGALTGLTAEDVTECLGFPPNAPIDPTRQTMSWEFMVDEKPCSVWDYKGVRFSFFGEPTVMASLFGAEHVAS